MKALLVLVLVLVVAGGGMKLAGMPLPFIDYPVGPMGINTGGPGMQDIRIEPPGFNDFPAP